MLKIKDLTRLAEVLSQTGLIQEINQLKAAVDSHRPIPKEIKNRIFQKFRLDWNYNSNAIEGNKLTYGETVALLMHGITAKGKPLKDHLDVKGHNEGINLLLDIVKSERDFTQHDIRSLHEIILVEPYSSKTITPEGIPATRNISIGQYKTVPNHVKTPTGEMHYYASPAETPALMNELMEWYKAAKKNKKIHPFITGSLFHHRFVSIHPFDDGNGRMARLLMNLILMRNQYPLIVVPMKFREEYYGVLSQADVGEFKPLVDYFGNLLKHSMEIQLKGIRGEDISEPDDIDKEIELFVNTIPKKNLLRAKYNPKTINETISKSIFPIFQRYKEKADKLGKLFFNVNLGIRIQGSAGENHTINPDILYDNLLEVASQESDIKYIGFLCELNEYKGVDSPFDVKGLIRIEFNEYKYSIFSGFETGAIIEKFYHEQLSSSEINQIVKNQIKSIIKEIEQKSNQQ